MIRPRVLIISARELHQHVWLGSQFEAEDLACILDDVELLAPRPRLAATPRLAKAGRRVVRRALGLDIHRAANPKRLLPQGTYDLGVIEVATIRDLELLDAVPGWRRRCQRAVCIINELWQRDMRPPRQGGSLAFAAYARRLKPFDHIFVRLQGSAEPLARRIDRPCSWLPPATDALRFRPGPKPPRRSIDVLSIGRRSEAVHRGLLDFARATGRTYLFDTYSPGSMYDFVEHRTQFADLVKRSRFFVAHRAKIDEPEETNLQAELGCRYFEGAAGGAILIGYAPGAACRTGCFDWPDAIIDLGPSHGDVARVIEELEAQPERIDRISGENVRQSLLRHDFAYRWRSVLETAGLEPTARLLDRLQHLRDIASSPAEFPFIDRAAGNSS